MNIDDIIKRVDQLIELGNGVLASQFYSNRVSYVNSGKIKGFRSAVLSFIERLYGTEHSHYKEFNCSVHHNYQANAEAGIAILEVIRDEISGDWLFSIKDIVTAEIFTDFLEMAEYLMSKDYKDPAAVIAGSVLEEQLRQLCTKNGINVEVETEGNLKPKKADRLNSDLAKAEVYNKLDQKAVTAWLDLRNKAAHGKYDEYSKEQVQHMIQGITEFSSRMHTDKY